ncbi:unnamed protein product [Didymodactylos carnosus]|uniref:Endoplasmic reticulum transmembrane protein n=1 Tax=Didymodactylos carnosus TaxID=1234261 RepID=A0A814XZR4_9BILA|nr:unnamed protein product [Didymodactylos carnosus]CAF1222542.1 unnamed protein product [Didymodactylos carnosus]CAF3889942.1 unnamed protein product [Didymodactylos carnosus]CAF3985843.1 unnamed protein product [Didymodactylos carnosus]
MLLSFRWQKIFKSRLVLALTAGAKYYFNFIICIFGLLFLDSIRELRKYSAWNVKDLATPHGEANAHMKQFRSQRNFYIAGFALFLWFVIKRLVGLTGMCAREMANSAAIHKQAEGARRFADSVTSDDLKKDDIKKNIPVATGDAPRYIDPSEHDAELSVLKQGTKI